MRQRNVRLIIVGVALIVLAVAFFFYMMGLAPRSNDPQSLMQTVGTVSGVVGGIAIVVMIIGLIGRRKA